MSDISPDQETTKPTMPALSDITPATQAPSAPPAWSQPDRSAEMSAISPDQPATRRVTVRLPTADLAALDARADALNASRSDYLRTLVALPVELDLTSIRHATPGTESLTRPLGPDLALTAPGGQTERFNIQAITDSALESISNEVRSIGVNYNQSVKALNRFLKKYGNHRNLSQDERIEIAGLYERLAKQNKAIYGRLKALADDVESLSSKPTVNLTASGLARFKAPVNKNESGRRHRVRGRKHGANRINQMSGGDAQ